MSAVVDIYADCVVVNRLVALFSLNIIFIFHFQYILEYRKQTTRACTNGAGVYLSQ